MKAEYKNDTARGPGYGLIEFTGALFPSAPWNVSLQRSSDGKFLVKGGNGQWMGESAFFELEGSPYDDGSGLKLFLDPLIVDSLDQQEQYKVSLKGPDGEIQTARLKLNPVTFSRDDRRDNTARMKSKAKSVPAPSAGKDHAPKTNPQKEEETPPTPAQPAPASTAAPENLEMAKPPEASAKSPKRWLWLLLALIAVGVLLAFFLPKSTPDTSADLPQQSAPPRVEKKTDSAEEQVRKFFAQNSPPAQAALALAQSLPKTNLADQDAVYRLYYYAVSDNDPEAFLPYGDCLNPALPKWGSIVKNAPDALEAYEKARQANPEVAQKAIDNMLAWLEKQSSDGNAEAREWLTLIKNRK